MSHRGVVVAVVPLFNPSTRLEEVVARLEAQCAHVVLVDDGSAEESWADASRLAASDRVSAIRPGGNSGIAAALNVGVRHALSLGADFILTCDQDSYISTLYVAAAINRLRHSDRPDAIALVSCSAFNGQRVQTRFGRGGEALEPMQSGMLIRASAFEQVGYFSENLFIDCVDTDFYQRCRLAGLRTLSAPPCPFEHHLGGKRWESSFANRYSRHPPWRTFYVVRNRLNTLRLYGPADWEWALRILAIMVPGLAATLVSSPDRGAQWSAALMGYRAFRAGGSGRISETNRRTLFIQGSASRHASQHELQV